MHWKGFDGGEEAWAAIDGFFDAVRERSRPVEQAGGRDHVTDLVFDCVDAQPDRYAAVPTLQLKLRISETTGAQVHAIALRCQIRIEPQRRRYSPQEADGLLELFGEPPRWGDTLKPMQFATVSLMVPSFTGSTEIDLPVPCTYDFEVAASKYLHALGDGEVPLLLLFSGTVFTKGLSGFSVGQVPWHKEASYRLPVAVWREIMDRFFPGAGWIRVRRDTLDVLQRFKAVRALPTWDDALEALFKEAGEAEPVSAPFPSFELARKVADAVLYEGYLLYPYRASAAKNQARWQFGVLMPRLVERAAAPTSRGRPRPSACWSPRRRPPSGCWSASCTSRPSPSRRSTSRPGPSTRSRRCRSTAPSWSPGTRPPSRR